MMNAYKVPLGYGGAAPVYKLPTGVVKHLNRPAHLPEPPTTSALRAAPPTALQPVTSGRDPMLQAFEEYLRKHLRASDIAQDSDGIFLFNVNQVAYLVEGCQTKDQQKATKKRIQESMHSVNAVVKKCARTGNGK
jgi:hypothetical protein